MANDTITLVLDGEVSLSDFSKAVDGLSDLISSLTEEVAKSPDIDWIVVGLEAGSATATIQGIPRTKVQRADVEKVIGAYERVGKSLQNRKPPPYSQQVIKSVRSITSVLNSKIPSVRFETEETESIVSQAPTSQLKPHAKDFITHNLGAVRGRVQSLSKRGGLRFTLYDIIDDYAISCYLRPGSEELMRDAWDRLAIVQGVVTRNPGTGHAMSVRDISLVKVFEEQDGLDYRKAFGVAPTTSKVR